jgi:hypothetical protein
VKKKLEVENFSGILADNIRQDFYAAMTLANIGAGRCRGGTEGEGEQMEVSGECESPGGGIKRPADFNTAGR